MASPLPRYVRIYLNPTPELLSPTSATFGSHSYALFNIRGKFVLDSFVIRGVTNCPSLSSFFSTPGPKLWQKFPPLLLWFSLPLLQIWFSTPEISARLAIPFNLASNLLHVKWAWKVYLCSQPFGTLLFPTPFIKHVLHSRAKRAIVVVDLNKW